MAENNLRRSIQQKFRGHSLNFPFSCYSFRRTIASIREINLSCLLAHLKCRPTRIRFIVAKHASLYIEVTYESLFTSVQKMQNSDTIKSRLKSLHIYHDLRSLLVVLNPVSFYKYDIA